MTNAEIIVLVVAVIVVVNLMAYVRSQSDKTFYTAQRKQRMLSSIRSKFSSEGALVDQIMLNCLSTKGNPRLFQGLADMNLEDRRSRFCALCLEASYEYGVVEGVMLSREFTSAYRVLINFLPEEVRQFYTGKRSLYDIDPDSVPFALPSEPEEKKSLRERQEDLIIWNEIILPENEQRRKAFMNQLLYAFLTKQLALRFKPRMVAGMVQLPHTEQEEESSPGRK